MKNKFGFAGFETEDKNMEDPENGTCTHFYCHIGKPVKLPFNG